MTTTTRTHAAPWTLRRFMSMLIGKPARPGPKHPDLLTGREAVARHLFGEARNWDPIDLLEYDTDAGIRALWLTIADRRIAAANHRDRHVAALHGYTPEAWDRLPAPVQADLRESVVHADGFRA